MQRVSGQDQLQEAHLRGSSPNKTIATITTTYRNTTKGRKLIKGRQPTQGRQIIQGRIGRIRITL